MNISEQIKKEWDNWEEINPEDFYRYQSLNSKEWVENNLLYAIEQDNKSVKFFKKKYKITNQDELKIK